MPHKFANHEKITALSKWAGELQERLDRLKDAINDADTMDRWTGVPDGIRDLALRNAIDEAMEFARKPERWLDHYDRIKVSFDRYNEAYRLAQDVAPETDMVDGRQVFKVPVWATERIVKKLKDAGIRHWLNTI